MITAKVLNFGSNIQNPKPCIQNSGHIGNTSILRQYLSSVGKEERL